MESSNFSVQDFIVKMQASRDIRHHFYISYGAMHVVLTYIEVLEALLMQALSQFMYHRGVERLQTRIELPHYMRFLHLRYHSKQKVLFGFDMKESKPVELLNMPRKLPIDLIASQIVQLENTLFVFKPLG